MINDRWVHPDALTKRVGAPKLVIGLLAVVYFVLA